MKKLLFISLFILITCNLYAQTYPLTLNIENIGSNKGNIIVYICASNEEYTETNLCKYSFSIPAKKGTISQRINIDKGNYGIIVYHDENSNNMLDMAMFGKPTEKYGYSNNKYGPFGTKPPFDEAVIDLNAGGMTTTIKLRK